MSGTKVMGIAGWEAFSHGVFAITITLLVLDIRVPSIGDTPDASALIDALVAEGPRYAAYALSFMYVGAYWIATHRSLRMARGVDHRFLAIGLVYLMFIALVPFVAALLAEYIGADGGRDRVVLVVFCGWQLTVSILANLALQYSYRAGLLDPDLDPRALRSWLRVALAGTAVWVGAIVAALVIGVAALALPAVVLPFFLREAPLGGQREGRPDGTEPE
jgi:uncharacterized membrane protein